jgi:UDPglucose 6-dehydrogenase
MITRNERQNILIFGTGYVGLVTAVGLAKLGHTVSCFDIDQGKIDLLKQGVVPFFEPGLAELLKEGLASGQLRFYATPGEAYSGQRYVFVAVPTPMNDKGGVDLSSLYSAIGTIAELAGRRATFIIIKSTVPVGIFSELREAVPLLDQGDFTFVSCPEFLSEGNAVHDFFNPRRTVVGSENREVSEEVAGLYGTLNSKIILTDAKTAQMIKYSANSFLASRVAFINEIAQLCEALNVNVTDVSSALLMDPRLGDGYLTAGVGFAGPCLPKDVSALIDTAKRMALRTPLLNSLIDQNFGHLNQVIESICRGLDATNQVSVFGLSFKPKTDDVRNSFSLRIINALAASGIEVRATDPHSIAAARSLIPSNLVSFWDDPMEAAIDTDRQVFLTPWKEYSSLDLRALGKVVRTKSIFDATGLFDPGFVIGEGFQYLGVGRRFGPEGAPAFILPNLD